MNKKNLVLLIAIIFFISTFSGILSAEDVKIPKKALKLEKKADKATKKKEYDKAMELYKQALEIHQDMETVHYKIASIHAFKKNYKGALKELKTTLKLNSANENAKKALIDTTLKYGSSLLRERKIADANELFIDLSKVEGIKEIDAKLVTELDYRIGFNFFQLRKAEMSNEYLLKFVNAPTAQELFKNFYSTANYLIGLNYSQLENVENSNKYLLAFVDITKENPDNKYLGFAKYIVGMNNFNTLKTKIDKIEKAKNRKNLKESNKKILKIASSEKGIEDNLLFAVEKNPNLENAYVILGNFYYLKKDIDNSIKYYKLLIEKFPGSADVEVYKVFLKDIEKRKK
ncbi:MAG: tetratricopeptide repeat protein [Acidobacteriota bacterium]